jgi:uncharacterized protein YcfJ
MHTYARITACTRPLLLVVGAALTAQPMFAAAEFEEVRIVRTEPIQIQQPCPPGVVAQAPVPAAPPPPQSAPLVTGKEALGTAAGAVAGGVLGNQIGSGSGRTAATVVGAAAGGFAGYKIAEEKPKPAAPPPQAQQAQPICLATQYRVFYARPGGLQGDVVMSSQPTGQSLMVNFCGDKPCM